MTQRNRLLWIGLVGLGLALVAGQGLAGGSPVKSIDEIAAAFKKGDEKAATAAAKKFAKASDDPVYDAMITMKLTTDKVAGVGVGGAGPGIEKVLQDIAKDGIKADYLKKNASDLEQMAYRMQAIGEVAHATPQKKSQAQWKKLAGGMRDLSQEFAKAVKSGNAGMVQKVATKLDANCNQCHENFRAK